MARLLPPKAHPKILFFFFLRDMCGTRVKHRRILAMLTLSYLLNYEFCVFPSSRVETHRTIFMLGEGRKSIKISYNSPSSCENDEARMYVRKLTFFFATSSRQQRALRQKLLDYKSKNNTVESSGVELIVLSTKFLRFTSPTTTQSTAHEALSLSPLHDY